MKKKTYKLVKRSYLRIGIGLWLLWVGCLVTRPVLAHESRPLLNGKYLMRVGFLEEPAYQGLENGLELTICLGDCVSSKDVPGTYTNGLEGAFDTLKVEVIYGSQSMPLTIGPVPRNPGRYAARFVPTRAGDYTFHISGTLGPDKDKIDERFTSGPNTFDAVQPLTAAQFPDKPGYTAPSPASAGSPATTAPVVTASASTTTVAPASTTPAASNQTPAVSPAASVQELQTLRNQINSQQQQLNEARNNSATTGLLAWAGLGAGIIGIALALLVGWRSRARREPEGG